MSIRFQIRLNAEEFNALRQLSSKEFRDYHKQAALLIHQELEMRGLLKPVEPHPVNQGSVGENEN